MEQWFPAPDGFQIPGSTLSGPASIYREFPGKKPMVDFMSTLRCGAPVTFASTRELARGIDMPLNIPPRSACMVLSNRIRLTTMGRGYKPKNAFNLDTL